MTYYTVESGPVRPIDGTLSIAALWRLASRGYTVTIY